MSNPSQKTPLRIRVDAPPSLVTRLDLFLTQNYPRVRVLRLHLIIPISVVMTATALMHGNASAGAPDKLNDTNAIAAAWFFLSSLPAGLWVLAQWRDREDLPRGSKGAVAWSGLVTFLCLQMLFLPPIAYAHANAAAIRELIPAAPFLSAHDELASVRGITITHRDRHGNIWEEYETRPGIRFFKVGPTALESCKEIPSKCIQTGYRAFAYPWVGPTECVALREISSESRKVLDYVYGAERIISLCESPEGSSKNETRATITDNLVRALVAHDACYQEGLFRGPLTLSGFAGFLLFLSGIVSLAGVLPSRLVIMYVMCCVCLAAFAITYGQSLQISQGYAWAFKGSLLLGVASALVGVVLSQRRRWWSELMAANLVLIGPVMMTMWWALARSSFSQRNASLDIAGFTMTEGAIWSFALMVFSLCLSPVIGALFDRYRNLPRDR